MTRAKIWFAFWNGGVLWGSFWLVWEVEFFCSVRLSHLFNERKMFCCKMPYSSAEIPPAGAPSGFDGTPQAFALK